MVKNHLKRLATSKTWKIGKKGNKYVTKPNPGAHSLENGYALVLIIRDFLKLSKTKKETRDIILKQDVLVDQNKKLNHRYNVGVMDVISFPKIKKDYRIVLNNKGKIDIIEIDEKESKIKIEKIVGKCALGKKFQLNLSDGRNVIIEKNDYKVNDSIVISLPEQKIMEHLPLNKNSTIILTGGKHSGKIGVVENIESNKLHFKDEKNEIYETTKKHAFVVGKEKPYIKLK